MESGTDSRYFDETLNIVFMEMSRDVSEPTILSSKLTTDSVVSEGQAPNLHGCKLYKVTILVFK